MKLRTNSRGFSLVEVLISVVLLAVIVGPMLAMFLSSTRTTVLSRDMTIATYTTQLIMEEMKGLNAAELDAYISARSSGGFHDNKGIYFRIDQFQTYENGGVIPDDMRGVRVVALNPPDDTELSSFSNILYPE